MRPERSLTTLPNGWAWATLGEVGAVFAGGTPSTKEPANFDGGVPWLTPADLSAFHGKVVHGGQRTLSERGLRASSAVLLPAGAVLFSSRAPIGHVAIAAQSMATNQGFKNLVPNAGIFNEYVYYYLKGNKQLAESLASGTTFLELSASRFAQIPIPVAPTQEQHRIVARLEELLARVDAGVEALLKVKRQLQRYRQAVLKAAFQGKLTQEWRRQRVAELEPAEALLARIRKTRRGGRDHGAQHTRKAVSDIGHGGPQSYDTAVLPELPDGWCWAAWEEIGQSQNGRPFPSRDYQSTGIKLLRPGNLHSSGRVAWTSQNTRCLAERWASDYPTYVVGPGEIVMNLTAQSLRDEFLGRVCMTEAGERCLLNQRIARLQPVGISRRYVFWLLKSPLFRRFVDSLNSGSLIQHMFTSQLATFMMPLAPLAEQTEIVRQIEARFASAAEVEGAAEQGTRLAEPLRQSILKRAFEGKLVLQDPRDEPAAVLLERIESGRQVGGARKAQRGRRARR